jgi:hypothetical protein
MYGQGERNGPEGTRIEEHPAAFLIARNNQTTLEQGDATEVFLVALRNGAEAREYRASHERRR